MKWIFIYTLAMTLFTGCSAGKKEVILGGTSGTGSAGNQGGSDAGGGGNGVNQRPLEDYHVDIRNLPEYQSLILEIIKNLAPTAPRVAADFLYLSREKDWYFLPADLDPLSENSIGTAFRTDQIAIQKRDEVWIDSRLYNAMSEESKSKLLLHELLMGVKILGFANRYDLCLSQQAGLLLQPGGEKAYSTQRTQCQIKTGSLPGINVDGTEKTISISEDDYSLIRKMVDVMYDNGGKLAEFDLQAEFKIRGFRNYEAQ